MTGGPPDDRGMESTTARPTRVIRLGLPAEAADALLSAAIREDLRPKDKAARYIIAGLRSEAYLPPSPASPEGER